MKFKYVCETCKKEYESDKIMYTCPECEKKNNDKEFRYGNLIVEYDPKSLRKLRWKCKVTPSDFAPYCLENPQAFPSCETPLVKPLRISKDLGLSNLYFKLDSQLISGSFKDRASRAVIAQAQHFGIKKIALASTGNAGAAMSCLGAAYGIEIVLFVPETAPVNKLMQSILYGATVVPVKGTYDDAFALSIEYTKHFGGINRNTAYNPMTIEGKKSVSIEIFNQFKRSVPDVVYVPVGDGCIISGVAKGFYDLKKAGLIKTLPRLVACQSAQSDAIARAIRTGEMLNIEKATTRADSISVESPAAGRTAVMRVKESNGWEVVVDDSEILKAQRELASSSGVFVEPASATAYAALKKDVQNLRSKGLENAKIMCLFTGTAFKDMAVFTNSVAMPESIENSVQAVIDRFKDKN